jgi:hypothetical protein
MNRSFKSSDFSFDTNEQNSVLYQSFTKTSTRLSTKKQFEIASWLENKGISFPIELIPEKFSSGSILCEIINLCAGGSINYFKNPSNPLEKKLNIRKAFGFLRKLKNFKSSLLWNEDDIFFGKSLVIWTLLDDLKVFSESRKSFSSTRKVNSSFRKTAKMIHEDDQQQVLADLVSKVKTWLEQLGLSHLLKPHQDYVRDNLRNGVVLCSVLQMIQVNAQFCEFPENAEEVYNNIEVALNGFEEVIPVKKKELYFYTECEEVWNLLNTVMMFFPQIVRRRDVESKPYPKEQTLMLKESVLAWVKRVVPRDDLRCFEDVLDALKTGELLAKIVTKVTGKEVHGILANPKTSKVCLSNIEKCLSTLQSDRRISQEYIRDSEKIFSGDEKFVLLLLEDLHRAHAGLATRKRGKSYHTDGPFIVPSTRSSLTPERSYSSTLSFSKPSKPEESSKKRFKLIENTRTALEFYLPPEELSFPKQNLGDFQWLGKIGVKLPVSLDLTSEKIEQLADGSIFCLILSRLEYRDIENVSVCKAGTPAARRNLRLFLSVLRQKPSLSSKVLYLEDQLFAGDGEMMRLVLREIYRIYKNTIFNLIRFNRKNRNSSFI